MRALITTQVFPPEIHPTAVMVDQLARHLSGAGHEVVVACGFPHHPTGEILGNYVKRAILWERRDGYRVVRGWHVTSPRRAIAARATVMVSQALGMTMAGRLAMPPDVVISYGPPFVGPLFSSWLARRSRAKLLTVIYDIYPDVAIETGKVTNPVMVRAARVAERLVYRVSDRILVLSNGFQRALAARGVPDSKIAVVPVWLEANEITPGDRVNSWRAQQGIGPEKFVVLYAGTIGLVSGAAVVAGAAERLAHASDVLFLIVGEGNAKDALEREVASRRLDNVRFLPFQDRARLAEVQASADVALVTLAPGRGRTSVPSKVIAYMAAGRPIVASVDDDSDTAECVRTAAAGVVTRPGDADDLARAILRLRDGVEGRRSMGHAGRVAFEREFAASAALSRYDAVLGELVEERQ